MALSVGLPSSVCPPLPLPQTLCQSCQGPLRMVTRGEALTPLAPGVSCLEPQPPSTHTGFSWGCRAGPGMPFAHIWGPPFTPVSALPDGPLSWILPCPFLCWAARVGGGRCIISLETRRCLEALARLQPHLWRGPGTHTFPGVPPSPWKLRSSICPTRCLREGSGNVAESTEARFRCPRLSE